MKGIIGLGIESSCDETSASVVIDGTTVASNCISSQIDLHGEYFGVVPEIASRAHLETINGIVARALDEAKVTFSDLDYVAATNRPGLVGSLLIGLQSAKAIAYSRGIPLIAINHLEAHLFAPFLEGEELHYPFLGLLVSGGNTALVIVRGLGDLQLLGATADDAIGEAFDKVAKHFEIGYPGGPLIEAAASRATIRKNFLPKLLADRNDYGFSYSGLKTAVISWMNTHPETPFEEFAWSFQERALELLVRRVSQALRETGIKKLSVAGGVAANGRLRALLGEACGRECRLMVPSTVLCTDNGAMIAGLGYRYFQAGIFSSLDVDVSPRVSFSS